MGKSRNLHAGGANCYLKRVYPRSEVWDYSCFFPYSDGQGKDYIWESHFVPKKMVELHSGKGFNFPLYADGNGAVLAEKYLYITDTKITGNASNSTNANNKKWVLRYVIGV